MVVRIPGLDEPALFGPPIVSEATLFDELPEETRAEMERLQAIDDAVFIACSLADLTNRQRSTALAAEEQAFLALDDPEAAAGHVDGFAARLDDGFAADVEAVVQEQGQLTGSRPSAEGLDLFRRRAEGVRRGALARNVMLEDGLRQRNQRRMMMRAIDGLQATVEAEPDVLDEALGRLGDLTGASRALIGDELAGELDRSTRFDLATTAAKGLIAQDPETGLEAIRSGAYESHFDEVTRKRLIGEAEGLSRARSQDRERRQRQRDTELTNLREAAALSFITGFRARLETDEAGFAEIATARRDGTLSRQRADTLNKELEQRQQRITEERDKLRRVTSLLDEGTVLDPQDPEHKDLAEIYLEKIVGPGSAGLSPKERIGLFEELPDTLGLMPERAMCPLGGMVLAGEPDDRLAAARAVTKIVARQPDTRDCLPPWIIPLADQLTEFARLEIPAEKSIEMAESELRHAIAIDDSDNPPRSIHAFETGENTARIELMSAVAGEGGGNSAPSSPSNSGGAGEAGQGTQVAMAPAAALPAIVGGIDASAVGKAILGALGAAGILSLGGDTPQDGAGAGTVDDGEAKGGSEGEESDKGENTTDRSGQTEPQPPNTPDQPDPPTPKPPEIGENTDDGDKGISGRTKNGVPLSPKERQKAIRSTGKVIREHEEKLRNYSEDPDASDNQGRLRNARTPEEREEIIRGRKENLERTIRRQQRNLEKFKKGE